MPILSADSISDLFLSLAVGQIELTWVQYAPPEFKKEYSLLEEQYTHCIMIIFSHGGFKEQVEN
jgi:hypothetical protein